MPSAARHTRNALVAGVVYIALILWGSLFPFTGWKSAADPFAFIGVWSHQALSAPDLVVNALIYIPLGICLGVLMRARSAPASILLATVFSGLLSFSIEAAQSHLPQRVPALSDFVLNTAGGATGALIAALFTPRWRFFARLMAWRARTFQSGREADIALAALAGWALSQLAPFVPSLDVGTLRSGLAPLAATLSEPDTFLPGYAAAYALALFALTLLARDARRREVSIARPLWLFVLAVLALKVPVLSRQLSAEALAGCCIGLLAGLTLPRRLKPARPSLAALAMVLALTVSELAPEPGALRTMNWTPFVAHLNNPLRGLSVLIDAVWPYLTLAAALWRLSSGSRAACILIAALCASFSFGLEWMQQHIPGRTPDITTVLMAIVGAALAVGYLNAGRTETAPERARPRVAPRLTGTVLAALLLGSATTVWSLMRTPPPTVTASSRSRMTLPAPEELTLPAMPGFRTSHPRLPYPSAADIVRLRTENPDYIEQMLKRARGGRGELSDAIQAAVLVPESQDVRVIVERVLKLKPTWRGHAQTKPIARTYDWLHDRIPPDLMPRLKDKVIEACNHQIKVIRAEALSPYNVYLYNSPFQALMACALAIHRDDPRADPVMAFTYDYWVNRVLPVWRQIGGHNGGWHEGNEYVGIGIGQAIYQLPAMWRSATGEDLFKTETALRGFLDFLALRLLPDGSSVKIGDGRFGRRGVDDALALALEYRHAAAYTLYGRPNRKPVPTSWPWGPLTDDTLYSPEAVRAQPLTHFADGTGWLLARSSWDADATYLSFKAGDNYWSHTHLDQGSFTIYKGAPLALDSGCYCGYGSDHHLNYHYQTIAHNTVTVTDPADTLLMPARQGKQPRTIANDGGQRRVGSGWDLHAAPMDIDDWRSKFDDFHTGHMEKVVEQDGLLIALADITAAYTNSQSGAHSFHHRTRRVERAWRIFIYDRVTDTVVVQDTLESTQAGFAKRWLLHAAEAPRVDGRHFTFERPATGLPTGIARLEGEVLFPQDARITPIGGRGFEYFVDGHNYDENGTLANNIARGPTDLDPGAWRLEIAPPRPALEDRFLVVMRPGSSPLPDMDAHAVDRPEGLSADIVLPGRRLELLYAHDRLAVDITLTLADGSRRTVSVSGEGTRAPPAGWIDRLRAWVSR